MRGKLTRICLQESVKFLFLMCQKTTGEHPPWLFRSLRRRPSLSLAGNQSQPPSWKCAPLRAPCSILPAPAVRIKVVVGLRMITLHLTTTLIPTASSNSPRWPPPGESQANLFGILHRRLIKPANTVEMQNAECGIIGHRYPYGCFGCKPWRCCRKERCVINAWYMSGKLDRWVTHQLLPQLVKHSAAHNEYVPTGTVVHPQA